MGDEEDAVADPRAGELLAIGTAVLSLAVALSSLLVSILAA